MLTFNSSKALPIRSLDILDKPLDWTSLWEKWSCLGPVALLESAGPLREANQWVIVAGGALQEVWEEQGQCCLRSIHPKTIFEPGLGSFLDTIGKNENSFLPFPYSLAQAWLGLLSYEFGSQWAHPQSNRSIPKITPDYYFFKPSRVIAFNRKTGECYQFGDVSIPLDNQPPVQSPFEVGPVKSRLSQVQYENNVRKAQAYIAAGDIYQANLAQSFQAVWKGNPAHLYRTLREINPSPFMGLFQGRNFTVVSSSPERLVAGQGHWLETRPIAGTRPRGINELDDLQQKSTLQTNAKEQAEHLMLVDLARNDLGRVCEYGSVEVKRFAEIESYSKVHHLVSVIQGRKNKEARMSNILQALFPAGTITGCPKIRCMEIIRELENIPRGFYTGSMGYVGGGPCFDFNILIRSFTLWDNGLLDFYAGAGIVADSDPRREYMETLYKIEALAQALGTSLVE